MNSSQLIICIPVLNEEQNILLVISDISESLGAKLNWSCIIVDNGSTDDTFNLITRLSEKDPRIIPLKINQRGLGIAYTTALEYLYKYNITCDYLVTMDGDGTHKAAYIKNMISLSKPYSVIIGSRFVTGGGLSKNIAKWRLLTGSGSSLYLRLFYRDKLMAKDCSGGFRLYSKEAVEIMQRSKLIRYPNFVFQLAVLYWLRKEAIQVIEMPVILQKRIAGKSNMKILKYIYEIISFTLSHPSI